MGTPETGKKRLKWRPWMRAMHRDLGYIAVGLTLVYALSGLALNHIADWDSNFSSFTRTHQVTLTQGDEVGSALRALDIDETPTQIERYGTARIDVTLTERRSTLHINPQTGQVVEEGSEPRFLLRVLNWLHLNRGKAAWTLIADAFAGVLVFLAISGVLMIPGRQGIKGRGAWLVSAGVVVPLLYVILSGGP